MKLVSLSAEPLNSQRSEGAGWPSTEKGMHQWCSSTAWCRRTLAGTAGERGGQGVGGGRARAGQPLGSDAGLPPLSTVRATRFEGKC